MMVVSTLKKLQSLWCSLFGSLTHRSLYYLLHRRPLLHVPAKGGQEV